MSHLHCTHTRPIALLLLVIVVAATLSGCGATMCVGNTQSKMARDDHVGRTVTGVLMPAAILFDAITFPVQAEMLHRQVGG
jgi:uncharacterized protein YceK